MKLMKFNNNHLLLLMIYLALLAGCGEMQVRVTHKTNPNYDFSKINSYEIVKNKQDKFENLKVDEPWLNKTITTSINDILKSKGLTENPEQAQVIVSYYVVIEETADTVVVDNYYNHYYQYSTYPSSAMPSYRKIIYNKGTLVIDIVDKKTKQFVWRGSADKVVRDTTKQEQREKNIHNAVEQIFKQFPR